MTRKLSKGDMAIVVVPGHDNNLGAIVTLGDELPAESVFKLPRHPNHKFIVRATYFWCTAKKGAKLNYNYKGKSYEEPSLPIAASRLQSIKGLLDDATTKTSKPITQEQSS